VVRCCPFTNLPFLPLRSLRLRTQGLHISSSSRKRVETWPRSDRRYLLSRLWLADLNCDLCHLQGIRLCGQVSPRSRNCPDLLSAHAVSTTRRRSQSVCHLTHHLRIQLFELCALFVIPAKSVHRQRITQPHQFRVVRRPIWYFTKILRALSRGDECGK